MKACPHCGMYQLHKAQSEILKELSIQHHNGLSLTKVLGKHSAAVTRTLQLLEKHGLITRTRVKGKHEYRLVLTSLGWEHVI